MFYFVVPHRIFFIVYRICWFGDICSSSSRFVWRCWNILECSLSMKCHSLSVDRLNVV